MSQSIKTGVRRRQRRLIGELWPRLELVEQVLFQRSQMPGGMVRPAPWQCGFRRQHTLDKPGRRLHDAIGTHSKITSPDVAARPVSPANRRLLGSRSSLKATMPTGRQSSEIFSSPRCGFFFGLIAPTRLTPMSFNTRPASALPGPTLRWNSGLARIFRPAVPLLPCSEPSSGKINAAVNGTPRSLTKIHKLVLWM
jgi:hypothetical protein